MNVFVGSKNMLTLSKKYRISPEPSETDWTKVTRGTPLANGSYFVRYEESTGYVFDDMGGYTHYKNCKVAPREIIAWIEHDQTAHIPVNPNDKVLIETVYNEHLITRAKIFDWTKTKRFRVLQHHCEDDSFGSTFL